MIFLNWWVGHAIPMAKKGEKHNIYNTISIYKTMSLSNVMLFFFLNHFATTAMIRNFYVQKYHLFYSNYGFLVSVQGRKYYERTSCRTN